MSQLDTFLWGAGGSLAIEIIAWAKCYSRSKVRIPPRYAMFGFYFSQLLLAAVAGSLAVAYEIQKPLLAANIGAAAPLLIQALTHGINPPPKLPIEDN